MRAKKRKYNKKRKKKGGGVNDVKSHIPCDRENGPIPTASCRGKEHEMAVTPTNMHTATGIGIALLSSNSERRPGPFFFSAPMRNEQQISQTK
jgi:hypothetical protein